MNSITLLGSFYREDVITDLMANLINSEKKFADWFLKTICDIDIDEIETANAQTRKGLGKGIGTPDLIIEKKRGSITTLVIVIENKLGALEGVEQTNRYASDQGKKALLKELGVEDAVPFKFLFLTLDPYTPASNKEFQKKDYTAFLHTEEKSGSIEISTIDWGRYIEHPVAIQLLKDYCELLREFYQPILNCKPSNRIAETTEKLDSLQKKLIWINVLQQTKQSIGLDMKFGEAGGMGRSMAVFLFSKPQWKQDKYDGHELLPTCANIHYELSVNLLKYSKVQDFALHYEPYPYKPKHKYENVKGYTEYDRLRTKRREFFHESIKGVDCYRLLTPRRGSNSFLRITIKKNERFEDVINELTSIMYQITPFIDDVISNH